MSGLTSDAVSPELAVLRDICRALLAFRGEAAVVSLAEQVVRRYPGLPAGQKARWFEMLLLDFGPDSGNLAYAVDELRENATPQTMAKVARAAEPARQELLRRINTAPGGTSTIVEMRADLLALIRKHPELAVVDQDFEHLLRSWFNRGFLMLERIDWDSPAAVLERLIRYEAVHEIRSWDDLRRRLAADRRCYGFFHPALPGEPLIFIEIALTSGLASNVQSLLDEPAPSPASGPQGAVAMDAVDTAIFYSITNCQAGLAGIPFGDLLIKQVAATIAADVASVRQFATLSPVPGFGRWLADQPVDSVLHELDNPGWHEHPTAALADRLVAMCAYYLVHAKSGRMPTDPVARFHLRNGARLERINWLGDTSTKGLSESAGLLVNYVYDEDQILANHEEFLNAGRVACSAEVQLLADGWAAAP